MKMSKYPFITALSLLVCLTAFAQVKPKKVVKKPAVVLLKNATDSFNYGLGMNIALSLQDQGVTKVNNALLKKAMDDVFTKKPYLITEQQANMSVQKKLQEFMAQKLQAEKDKGTAFMKANALRNGVYSLPNGLQYEVLKAGDSTSISPRVEDTVVAHYAGTLLDGTGFDNSYQRGAPLTIPVGNVIQGWTEILQLMHIGDKWKVYIPSNLGYGDRGTGAIPAGATLIFEMELLDVLQAKSNIQQPPIPVEVPVNENSTVDPVTEPNK